MDNTKEIGKFSALLSLVELSLGSFFHAIRAPFTGQLLSLNQSFILTRASIKIEDKSAPAMIGNTAALLKSLAPAGKKITPMLAISAQGNLYSAGLYILGNNFLGRMLGSLLLSLWAYIQPLAIYLLLFGEDLFFMSQYFINKITKVFSISEDQIVLVMIGLITLKLLIAFVLVILAHLLSDKHFSFFESWAINQKRLKPKTKKTQQPLIGAIKDLLNPFFLISLLLMLIFFFYTKSKTTEILWQLMRPIAGGFIIFYILRVFPIEKFVKKLKNGKYKEVLFEAIRIIKS